jgi:hypothetical protein
MFKVRIEVTADLHAISPFDCFACSASDLTEGARGKLLALFDVDALSQATRDGDQDTAEKNDRRNRMERRPKFREETRQRRALRRMHIPGQLEVVAFAFPQLRAQQQSEAGPNSEPFKDSAHSA